ncbi:DUF402 domain-containing protein [Dactylosporangium siamense]|uniref:DUF402 domain-containing protein n=1 Tax=Dactylosporangium siamense TaxID=685454 RepID=A0A919Q2D2_9ACTN|nr:DUF402 domain-containing protein [Dactylosporangium siamense]GIG53013.1 hypothetical protein Dsi01nite_110540 [Dactylosporangium siamense]
MAAATVRRYFRGPHLTWAQATRVVADDARGLLLWLPEGAGFACRVNDEGDFLRASPTIDAYGAAPLSVRTWRGADVLLLHPPGAAHSVWWFFTGGVFTGWYVNLESPAHRRAGGIDVVDHHLDVVVAADRTWRWKDEDEFLGCVGLPGFWDEEQAAAIRAEGERVVAALEARVFPFDGTWCDFVPDAGWPTPALPPEYSGDPAALKRG